MRWSENQVDPEVRAVLKKQLMNQVFATVQCPSFNPAIGDQMSRLAVHFTRNVPQASFREDTTPKSGTPQALSQGGILPDAPEQQNIFTDDEEVQSEVECRLDSESDVGRVRSVGESVAKLNKARSRTLWSNARPS